MPAARNDVGIALTNYGTQAAADWDLRPVSGIRRSETGRRIAEHRAVIDAQRFYPTLLAQGEPNEKTQLDQFRNREVVIKLLP